MRPLERNLRLGELFAGYGGLGMAVEEVFGAELAWVSEWEAAPSPVEMSPTGKPRLSAHFAEWMMGLPAGWITDVPGVGWGDQLKACGNGVVPAQAAAALHDMLAAFETKEIAA